MRSRIQQRWYVSPNPPSMPHKFFILTSSHRIGFIIGTSGSLFNQLIYVYIHRSLKLKDLLGDLLSKMLSKDNDIATYPNPFLGLEGTKFNDFTMKELNLADGGEDGEVIPPLDLESWM